MLAQDLVDLLLCPESKQPLVLVPAGVEGAAAETLFCPASRLRYRIDDGVPVMLVDEADRLDEAAAKRLLARLA
jgi:uncharacterized protein YbaR (Trm112 family)